MGFFGDINLGILVLAFLWLSNLSYDDIESYRLWTVQHVKLTGTNKFLQLIVEGKNLYKERWKKYWVQMMIPLILALLIAFNIGMFGPPDKGWKVLEYGVAIVGGVIVLGAIKMLHNIIVFHNRLKWASSL